MENWCLKVGLSLLGGAIIMFVPSILYDKSILLYAALTLFVVSVYLIIEGIRWSHWKNNYYNEVEGCYMEGHDPPTIRTKISFQVDFSELTR
jgi:hypothetical protein